MVAGGTGDRMGASMPKQFLELAGKPVIMRTLQRFFDWNPELSVILVLHPAYIDYWHELCEHCDFKCDVSVVPGGKTRFHSVQAGVNKVGDDASIIGVHDAVRPLVSVPTIELCYRKARSHGAAIPVIEIVDSLRVVSENDSHIVDRNRYRAVQTPQCFEAGMLRRAYAQDFRESFTDSASVVEASGEKVHLVEGNRDNIKLTTPTDMVIAEAIWGQQL